MRSARLMLCAAVVASTRDEVALALSEQPVSHILVAQDLVEAFSSWITEGGLASAGAEVSVLGPVSTTLMDNPVSYGKMVRALMATVQLLSDERAETFVFIGDPPLSRADLLAECVAHADRGAAALLHRRGLQTRILGSLRGPVVCLDGDLLAALRRREDVGRRVTGGRGDPAVSR